MGRSARSIRSSASIPAASLVEVASLPGEHKDETLILANVGRKALRQVEVVVSPARAALARGAGAGARAPLSSGVWTHDHPLMATELEQLGLPVKFGVPDEERALMNLYPQPRGRQESVESFPRRRSFRACRRGATVHARSGLRHAQLGSCRLTAGAKARAGRAG